MMQKYNRTLYYPNILTYLTFDVNCVKTHCRVYYIEYLCAVHLVLLHSFTTNLVVYEIILSRLLVKVGGFLV